MCIIHSQLGSVCLSDSLTGHTPYIFPLHTCTCIYFGPRFQKWKLPLSLHSSLSQAVLGGKRGAGWGHLMSCFSDEWPWKECQRRFRAAPAQPSGTPHRGVFSMNRSQGTSTPGTSALSVDQSRLSRPGPLGSSGPADAKLFYTLIFMPD